VPAFDGLEIKQIHAYLVDQIVVCLLFTFGVLFVLFNVAHDGIDHLIEIEVCFVVAELNPLLLYHFHANIRFRYFTIFSQQIGLNQAVLKFKEVDMILNYLDLDAKFHELCVVLTKIVVIIPEILELFLDINFQAFIGEVGHLIEVNQQ